MSRWSEFKYRVDLLALQKTHKISLFLNFLTGKASGEFFNFCNGAFAVFASFGLLLAIIAEANTSTWAHFWYAFNFLCLGFLWQNARYVKRRIEEDITYVLRTSSGRFWSNMIFLWMSISIPAPPYDDTLMFLIYSIAWAFHSYSSYCYLHNLPPRESAFSKAKNWVKSKAKNLVRLPQPLPSPA